MSQQITVQYMPISQIVAWDRNPKKHATKKIQASIRRFGFNQPVIMDEKSGKLVAGHGRVEALKLMKESGEAPPDRVVIQGIDWCVPVVRGVGFKDQKEADGYVVADNRMVELGGWDDDILNDILKQFQGETEDYMEAVGYDLPDLEKLVADTNSEVLRNKTPKEVTEQFMNAEIKQIVLYMMGDEYDALLPRLEALMKSSNTESHTELFLWMVENCEAAG